MAIVGVALFSLLAADMSGQDSSSTNTVRHAPTGGEEDRRVVVLVTALCLVQSALIVALVLQRRRQQRIEESLKDSEERIALATLPENLGLWQWNARTDEIWATEHFRDILQIPLREALTHAAWAATRTKNTYLATQFRRLTTRLGKNRALVAVGRSILIIAYHLLPKRASYQELGGGYFDRQNAQHYENKLVYILGALGLKVTLEPVTT